MPPSQRFFLHDFTRGTLGADKQHGTFVGGQFAHEFQRILEHRQAFFQVDDVDLVAVTEDVWCHLRVPETGLVAEVNTGLEHLTHGY
jgi:hypothetical protein